jgi:hypothetical protein
MPYSGYEEIARVLSPEAYCFILNKDSTDATDRLDFQLMPEGISESKSAMYNEVPIIGRSLPLIGYASSTSRMVNISLRFVSLNKEGKYSPKWVEERVRWLESKVYPRYENNLTYPPPRLLLVVGKALSMQCVMTSYNTTWMSPWTVEGDEARAFQASVDVAFQEYGQNLDIGHPFGHDEAKSGVNQGNTTATGEPYIQIPANVSTGFVVSAFGPSFSGG